MENYQVHNWMFHYNPYQKVWSAFKREDKEKYFNGELPKSDMLQSKDVNVLLEFLVKTKH